MEGVFFSAMPPHELNDYSCAHDFNRFKKLHRYNIIVGTLWNSCFEFKNYKLTYDPAVTFLYLL